MIGLIEVQYQFDAPLSDGQTRLPSCVGSMPGTTIGRPSGVSPGCHVTVLTYCFPSRSAVGPVEHVEVAVAIRLHEQLAGLALPGDIDECRWLHRVVVPHIVRREPKMPLQLSRLRIERDDGVRGQVVAEPIVADGYPDWDCRRATTACRAGRRRRQSSMRSRPGD